MLWLGVCLPRLPIEVFLRTVAPVGAEPLIAVCDRSTILSASASAEQLGVHPGMRRATALALAPELALLERDPAREHESLAQAACWALQFTPAVSLQAPAAPGPCAGASPAGLLLEVAASLRLFGGLQALVERLRAGLSELGFGARIACAPNPAAAWILARHEDTLSVDDASRLNARLSPLPVSLLDQARPHLDTLESIGVRTLRELAQLPRAGLARRFGPALLDELDRAFGRRPDPRAWFEAPPVFHARLELFAEVLHAEALLFGAQRLITQLSGWLGARHAAVRSFTLHGEHDDLPATQLVVRLTDASRESARLVSVLRELLAVTRLAAPVHTLRLHCDDIAPQAVDNTDLFPLPASTREGLGRLVERLQARLGRAQVQRLLLATDHRPECAYRLETLERLPATQPPAPRAGAHRAGAREGSGAPPCAGALPRPLWLLAKPIAITERNNRPFWHGPLTLLAGPERIESGWWDARLVQRDYFIAADDAGMLLWIYRERLPDMESRQGWFVHGRFG